MALMAPFRDRFSHLSHNARWATGYAVAAVVVFSLYQFTSYGDSGFAQKWTPLANINETMIWIIMAVGLNMVVGYAGLLDLGFVAFWAIGGYTAGWLMSTFFYGRSINVLSHVPDPGHGVHVSFWLILLIGGLFCALWGIIIGAPTLRLKSDYLAIVTMAFGFIIPQFFYNGQDIGGVNVTNGTRGINPIDPISIGTKEIGVFDLQWKFVIYVAIAVAVIWLSLQIREGRLGRAWLAIREDELAASMMGVPLMRTKLAAYAVGAFVGGLGGVAYATHVNAVIPDRFDFSISITLLAMVVLGGMGNVWGVILGAIVLSWVNNTGLAQFGNTVNENFGTTINFPSYNYLLFGGILVLMMLFRREGFLPEARTRMVMHEGERTRLEAEGVDMKGVTA